MQKSSIIDLNIKDSVLLYSTVESIVLHSIFHPTTDSTGRRLVAESKILSDNRRLPKLQQCGRLKIDV